MKLLSVSLFFLFFIFNVFLSIYIAQNLRYEEKVIINDSEILLKRNEHGILEIFTKDSISWYKGMGFAHAKDRTVQMILTALAGQGRLSEFLPENENLKKIDIFMRQLGLANDAKRSLNALSPKAKKYLESYAQGVNFYIDNHHRPIEFILAGIYPGKYNFFNDRKMEN